MFKGGSGHMLRRCFAAQVHRADGRQRGPRHNPREMLPQRRIDMAVAKVSEITAESTESFEDAIRQGIDRASKTLHGIRGAWVKEQKVTVDNGRITNFRVHMKVTFVLD
jgi:dodecin